MSTMTSEQIETVSEQLDAAEVQARAVPKITDKYPEMDFGDAYAVQWATRQRKTARGDRVVGLKMGFTSYAKMRQMGVEEPIYGFLADYFHQPEGAAIDTVSLIHPKVEAEIAFVTRKALRGPGCHVGQVLAATDFVMPAVEIIDSRYEHFRFDLPSVIADNASSSRFVTGSAAAQADALDLRSLGVVLEKNGEIVGVGAGAAVLNHPAASVARLANMLASRNEEIPADSLILSGGITAAVAVGAGDSVILRAQGLGSASMRFE